jgi:hypothetical protein
LSFSACAAVAHTSVNLWSAWFSTLYPGVAHMHTVSQSVLAAGHGRDKQMPDLQNPDPDPTQVVRSGCEVSTQPLSVVHTSFVHSFASSQSVLSATLLTPTDGSHVSFVHVKPSSGEISM